MVAHRARVLRRPRACSRAPGPGPRPARAGRAPWRGGGGSSARRQSNRDPHIFWQGGREPRIALIVKLPSFASRAPHKSLVPIALATLLALYAAACGGGSSPESSGGDDSGGASAAAGAAAGWAGATAPAAAAAAARRVPRARAAVMAGRPARPRAAWARAARPAWAWAATGAGRTRCRRRPTTPVPPTPPRCPTICRPACAPWTSTRARWRRARRGQARRLPGAADGDYGGPTITAKGSEAAPIVLRAANKLKANFTGVVTSNSASYVVLEGFTFPGGSGTSVAGASGSTCASPARATSPAAQPLRGHGARQPRRTTASSAPRGPTATWSSRPACRPTPASTTTTSTTSPRRAATGARPSASAAAAPRSTTTRPATSSSTTCW